MRLELNDEQKRRLGKIYHLLLTFGAQKDAADQDEPASTTRSAAEESRPVDRSGSQPEYSATGTAREIASN